MQLSDKTGVICDKCALSLKYDFVYYSLDFKKVSVIGNNKPPLEYVLSSNSERSLDYCPGCFENIKKIILVNYEKVMSPTRKQNPQITCEISSKKLLGTYDYYYCIVSEISVKMTGQPNICINCKTPSYDRKICSKCNGTNFLTPAKVNVNERYLEFSVCGDVYIDMSTISAMQQKNSNQWTTESE